MLNIDLSGKRALVAGVADAGGFGFAIAKSLAEAGASVCVGTWPPALNIFLNLIERGKMDEARRMPDGSMLEFERIYPLDAAFDTLSDAPEELRTSKRYKDTGDFSIEGMANRLKTDFGDKPLDIVVHSLANGSEVTRALLDTSRAGYLSAIGTSAYSNISLINRLSPLMRDGGSLHVADLHGVRAGDTGLRRGDVVGKSGARERYAGARLRSRPAVRPPGERHLGGAIRIAGGERHRHHRKDGGVLRGELTAAGATHARGSRARGRVSRLAAREWDHRHHLVRRQGVSRNGNGGGVCRRVPHAELIAPFSGSWMRRGSE